MVRNDVKELSLRHQQAIANLAVIMDIGYRMRTQIPRDLRRRNEFCPVMDLYRFMQWRDSAPGAMTAWHKRLGADVKQG